MSSPPEISILLPVFNGAKFLGPQIDSVLQHTRHTFELLAHDDASSDGSLQLLQQIASRDARIKVTGSHHNLGQKLTLLELSRRASGDFIMFCDQDDIWHADKIALLMDNIGAASGIFGLSCLIDAKGQPLGRTLHDHAGPPVAGRDCWSYLLGCNVPGHGMLVRRAVVHEGSFLGAPGAAGYDWAIAAVATFSDGLAYEPRAITYHRQHAENQMNRLSGQRKKASSWPRVRSQRSRGILLHDLLSALRGAITIPEAKRAVFAKLFAIVRHYLIVAPPAVVSTAHFKAQCHDILAPLAMPPDARAALVESLADCSLSALHPRQFGKDAWQTTRRLRKLVQRSGGR